MRIDRRLTFVGVMLIVLSMTMATQYATTRIGYEFTIVHPSEGDIRFIGSDISGDGTRVLRAVSNGTDTAMKVDFGELFSDMNKTYTAAFGIVNEETFAVNITHINVSTPTGTDYLHIWVHGARKLDSNGSDTSVYMWDKGSLLSESTSTAWQLSAGNGVTNDLDGSNTITRWDTTAGCMYSTYNTTAINGTDDYVWVQIAVECGSTAVSSSGAIFIHFEAAAV